MAEAILVLNAGSSSLRAALFDDEGGRRDFHYAGIGREGLPDHANAIEALLAELGTVELAAIGHRVVHGGEATEPVRRVDCIERLRLDDLLHLAPLHLPANLAGIDLCAERLDVSHYACFDTAFHATLDPLARRLPIPERYGMQRYGFHGISYSAVARRLPELLGEGRARGRVVVAHLGNGSSLCLIEEGCSRDTTMGFTPSGGVPMATRCGDIDPGVVVELASRLAPDALAELVSRQSGLLALSGGLTGDMRRLLETEGEAPRFAVDYYCRAVRGAIGALAAKAGGLDALIFTGGIGEHAAAVREAICAPLAFLGIQIDAQANQAGYGAIHRDGSLPVLVVPTDEEAEIARLVRQARDGA